MAGMWLVETVLSQAIFFSTGGLGAVELTNRKSGKHFTFSLIALDPTDRLQNPLVSLFFVMRSWWRMVLEIQGNSLDARFLHDKVGC